MQAFKLQFTCNAGLGSPSDADAAGIQHPSNSKTADDAAAEPDVVPAVETAAEPTDPASLANGHPASPQRPTTSENQTATANDTAHSPEQASALDHKVSGNGGKASATSDKASGYDDNAPVASNMHVVGEELDARALASQQQQNDSMPAASHAVTEQQSRQPVSSMHVVVEELDTRALGQQQQNPQQQSDSMPGTAKAGAELQISQPALYMVVVGEELDTRASDHHQQQQHEKLSLPRTAAERQSSKAAVEHIVGEERDPRSIGLGGQLPTPHRPHKAVHKSSGIRPWCLHRQFRLMLLEMLWQLQAHLLLLLLHATGCSVEIDHAPPV